MPFPLVKLGYLAIKQISKPLANAIKAKAKTTPFLRNRILLPPAHIYHKFETSIKMRLLGFGKTSEVKPLSEEHAVDLAAEMLGESIIFLIATGVIWLEYRRSQWKEQQKEDLQNSRLADLEASIHNLELTVETQSAMMRGMTRAIAAAGIPLPTDNTDEQQTKSGDLPKKITDPSSNTVLKVTSSTRKNLV